VGLAGFSITATFAPAIGPAIGGYLNDTYRWPWVFYVNLAPGAVMFAALWHGLPKADARLLVGAGLLVFGASCFMNLDLRGERSCSGPTSRGRSTRRSF
jgi:MFS family permease